MKINGLACAQNVRQILHAPHRTPTVKFFDKFIAPGRLLRMPAPVPRILKTAVKKAHRRDPDNRFPHRRVPDNRQGENR
jgi:hypothetical protein